MKKDFYKIRESISLGKSIFDLPLRVVFYARVSSESDEQLNSLDNQAEYYEEYIKDQPNWTFVKGYVDEGITGTSLKNRKKFLLMMTESEKDMFDLVITKSVSRYGRDIVDGIQCTDKLKKHNVGVFFEMNRINSFDSNSEGQLHQLMLNAQQESKEKSDSIKWGHARAIKKGHVLGSSCIIGYEKDKCKLKIIPEEAKFIKLLFELYASGEYGFYKLATKLAELGHLNKKGKIYHKSTLVNIIKNPKYKGYYRGNTTKVLDYKTKERKYCSEEEWVLYKADPEIIPAIVSEELWNKANDLLNARGGSFKDPANNKAMFRKYAYSGRMFCSEHDVTFQKSTGRRRDKRPIWACGQYMHYRLAACASPVIAEIDLDNICKNIMELIFSNKTSIIQSMIAFYSDLKEDTSYANEIRRLNDKIREIEEDKKNILRLNTKGKLSDEDWEKDNNCLNEDIIDLRKKITRIESEQRIASNNLKNINTIEDKIKEQFEFKDNIKDFVTTFVEEIVVSKINNDRKNIQLDIYLNFASSYRDNARGSRVKKGDIIPTELLKDIEVSSIETIAPNQKKDYKLNKFKYNVYINQG